MRLSEQRVWMAPCKPRAVKAQTVIPRSSPTSMAAKTAGKSVVKSQAGVSEGTQTVVDKAVELAPSGKDIMAAIKTCSETHN